MMRFSNLNNFIGFRVTADFIIFRGGGGGGGFPLKILNNFLFIDFLQSAKS